MLVDEKITKWFAGMLADITEDGTIVRFELYHGGLDASAELMKRIEVEEDVTSDELADIVWDAAEVDAATRAAGQRQRYVIMAYRADSEESSERFPFVLQHRGNDAFGGDTEPATEKGLIASQLRHSENLHRMMMAMTDATSGRLASEVKRLDAENRDHRENSLKMFQITQELMDQKQEREIEMAESMAAAQRTEALMGMGMKLLPLLVAKFMPEAAPAVTDTAVGESLKPFLRDMSDEEFQGILKALKPANQATFIQMFEIAQKQGQKEDAEKPAMFRRYNLPAGQFNIN